MNEFKFERLEVWKKSRRIVLDVYNLIKKFPEFEKFGLSAQLCRSIISVPSNIAEGVGRISYKEQVHFIEIAYGSLMEALTQIILASDLNYITPNELSEIRLKIEEIAKMLSGLRNNFLKQIK